MNIEFRDKFISQWRKYFKNAELPITFEYVDDYPHSESSPVPEGWRCVIAQVAAARNGRTVHFVAENIKCAGGSRYLGYNINLFPGFNEFISHGESGHGERYKKSPELVANFMSNLNVLAVKKSLIVKRWDSLEDYDKPQGVIFFAKPDVLSGLFTLANYDVDGDCGVIAPFGAGCTSIFFYPYKEYITGGDKAILGMFDVSARKCVKSDLLSFAMPISKFMKMVENMDESFLITDSWEVVYKRLD